MTQSPDRVRAATALENAERTGYLPVLRGLAGSMCAPIWWHGYDAAGHYSILHNGTVCFVDTGARTIAVTADHVLQQYLSDKKANSEVRAQIGGMIVELGELLISRSKDLDLATFAVSEIVAAAAGVSFHSTPVWPPPALSEGEVVIFGGYPGALRTEEEFHAELPFQHFAGKVTSVSMTNIALHLDLQNLHWSSRAPGPFNPELGGMSGGPVYRYVAGPVVERLELAGFIYEYQVGFELMLARHASVVHADGTLHQH